jgi:hypothetical protein
MCAPELDVHVADHVVSQVVAHVQVLNLAKLGQLQENVFVKVLQLIKERRDDARRVNSVRGP